MCVCFKVDMLPLMEEDVCVCRSMQKVEGHWGKSPAIVQRKSCTMHDNGMIIWGDGTCVFFNTHPHTHTQNARTHRHTHTSHAGNRA